MLANQVMRGMSANVGLQCAPMTWPAALAGEPAALSPAGLWFENWGVPDGRYRNTRSISRRSVYSGRLLRVLHRPRSQRARGGRPGTCAARLVGSGCDYNGRRNMVDALHRHARFRHADTDVVRHRTDHSFAPGGDL